VLSGLGSAWTTTSDGGQSLWHPESGKHIVNCHFNVVQREMKFSVVNMQNVWNTLKMNDEIETANAHQGRI